MPSPSARRAEIADPGSPSPSERPSLERLLAGLADLAVRRPWTLVIAASVLPLACGLLLLRTPVDLSFTGILDRGMASEERIMQLAAPRAIRRQEKVTA